MSIRITSDGRAVNPDPQIFTADSPTTLTNKTLDADSNIIVNLEVDNFKAGVVDTDQTLAADSDLVIPTQRAVKAYADAAFTNEQAQDAVGGILTNTTTITFTYSDATPAITARAESQMSITADASGLKLNGDSASPGTSKYFGTDDTGTKGFHSLPAQSYAHSYISSKTITPDASGVLIDGWTLPTSTIDFVLDGTDDSVKYTGTTTKRFVVNVSGTVEYTQTVASTGVFEVELRELVGATVAAQVLHTFQNASGAEAQKVQAPFSITTIVGLATNDKLGLYGVDANATSQSIVHKDINMTIVSLI